MALPSPLTLWRERRFPHRGELLTLILLAVVFTGGWGFLELADEIGEGTTRAFDERVLEGLRNPNDLADPLGPGWLEEAGRDITALGGLTILLLVTLGTAGYLFMERKPRAAWLVLAAIVGGVVLSFALKSGFDRPRPDLVAHGTRVYTSSFPSAHSMLSAIVYLTIGSLMARLHSRWMVKVYALTLALLLTLAVGASRVYLGVHWPTDVLAGWSGGAAWALLWWVVIRTLQKRGNVEPEGEQPEVAAEQQRATAEARKANTAVR